MFHYISVSKERVVNHNPKTESEELPAPRQSRNQRNLFESAYRQLEAMIANCQLEPGRHLSMQSLQDVTGLGRTPVHQAVARLSADTLIIVRPRHGLQIAPINIGRERTLLRLRRDMERFVIELAAERGSGGIHRSQMLSLIRQMRESCDTLDADGFNMLDARHDALVLAAAGEPFLEHTLRPLHSLFRRAGWLYLSQLGEQEELSEAVRGHISVLEGIVERDVPAAIRASDTIVDLAYHMLDTMERNIDVTLLDCSLGDDQP